MGYYVKNALPCIDCGDETHHRRSLARVPLCMTCGIARAIDHDRDLVRQRKASVIRDKMVFEHQCVARGLGELPFYPRSIRERTS